MRASFLIYIIAIAIVPAARVAAQINYPETDSLTFRLYSEKRWKELCRLDRHIDKDSLDYYYLNLRLGIACYERGKWNAAKSNFRAAMDKNPSGETAPLYLGLIYADQGWTSEAEQLLQRIDSSSTNSKTNRLKRIISDFYLEAGRKSSDEPDLAGAVNYYYAGWQQKLSVRWSVRHAVSFAEQALNWSNYNQLSYALAPTFYIGKGWYTGLTAGIISFRRDVNSFIDESELISRTNLSTPQGTVIRDSVYITQASVQGATNVFSTVLHLSLNKRLNDFSLGIQGAFYHDRISPFLDSVFYENKRTVFIHPVNPVNIIDRPDTDSFRIDSRSTISYYQAGLNFSYTIRLNARLSLDLGSEVQYVHSDNIKEVFLMPLLQLVNRGRYSFKAYYFEKGFYPVSVSGGTQIYNTPDRINKKISCTLGVWLNSTTSVYLTGQHEMITDAFTNGQYRLLSAYIGTYIKL